MRFPAARSTIDPRLICAGRVLAVGAVLLLAAGAILLSTAGVWRHDPDEALILYESDHVRAGEIGEAASVSVARATAPRLPLHFEPNAGQTDAQVDFVSRGKGYALHLTRSEAVLSRGSSIVRMRFPGANPRPAISGLDQLSGRSNYFTGNDQGQWHTDVPHYGRVLYSDLYPGIDLVFYGNDGDLEYDFNVSPGSDPEVIRLAFEGAEDLTLDDSGNLVLALPNRTGGGEIQADELILRAPIVYQDHEDGRRYIEGEYKMSLGPPTGRTVEFQIGNYDASLPLIIDPVLIYSTHLGGSVEERATDVTVDREGYAYLVGTAESADFPTKHALDGTLGGSRDAFIAKLTPDGSALVFATYLGGSSTEYGGGIGRDSAGNIYVTGNTYSTDFPTTNAVDGTKGGWEYSPDLFIAKLNPSASALIYSTYLGGDDDEYGGGIAVDGPGNVYLAGDTYSSDFPTANAWQPEMLDHWITNFQDAFVAKLPPSGKPLTYSTYLGGADDSESGGGIAIDASGNAYVTGDTWSTDFPTLNALKPVADLTWGTDAFVAKFNSAGAIVYSTYLGGDDSGEGGYDVTVDLIGNTYLTGITSSTDFPTKNAYQGTYQGNTDVYVTKLKPDGSAIMQSTYLGGSDDRDAGYAISVDANGSVFVTGRTDSSDFPTVNPLSGERSWDEDAFLSQLSPSGSVLMYSTYLGGTNGTESGYGLDVGESGDVYITGITWSSDFQTYRAMQPTNQGQSNAWVMRWQRPANFWLADAPVPELEKPAEEVGGRH
jgi:hypothetical protein